MKNFIINKWRFNYTQISDIICVKAGAAFILLLLRIKMIAGGKVSKRFIKSIRKLTYQLQVIQRSQGDYGLILFLKASQVALQQASSGYKVQDMRPLGARVSRTKGSMLPRVISVEHRKVINNNLPGKYYLIKFYLSLFYVYRCIDVAQYSLKLQTIIDPPKAFNREELFSDDIIYDFLETFIKHKGLLLDPTGYFRKYAKMFTILKSSPSNMREGANSLWSTHPIVMWKSMAALRASSYYDVFLKWSHNYFPNFLHLHSHFNTVFPSKLGKLSFKEEAAGKLRVFALVDCFTQWLLYPLHKVLFLILRAIPMDGTFNQLGPINRLLKMDCQSFYSLDLSAATDRLPISLQKLLLTYWIQALPYFGDDWSRVLTERAYFYNCPPGVNPNGNAPNGHVRYATGQPMGALSSWAMLAFTHHFIVQVAAWRVSFVPLKTLYTRYALLGDDLVIADKAVADSYLFLMDAIGVGINLNKSILSHTGKGLEFAKRTFIDKQDVSPISIRDLSISLQPGNIASWVAFSNAHGLSFTRQAHILGFGFKAIKTEFMKMNHALKVLFLANTAKVDFTTDILQLMSKTPIVFDNFVDTFKAEVLKPVLDNLDRGFHGYPTGDPNVKYAISPSTRWKDEMKTHQSRVRDWFETSQGIHFLNEETQRIYIKTIGIKFDDIGNSLMNSENQKTWDKIAYLIKGETLLMSSELTNYESSRIFEKLYKALNSVDLAGINTFDECLKAYLLILRLRAVQEIGTLRLQKKEQLMKSIKLPYQARMFRAWSRIVMKSVKRIQN